MTASSQDTPLVSSLPMRLMMHRSQPLVNNKRESLVLNEELALNKGKALDCA